MKLKMKSKWRITLIVLFVIVFGVLLFWPKAPQIPNTATSIEDLESYLEELTEDFGTPPGISLVVVKKDSIVYQKGFGWADKPKGKKATPETVYHWWSITKIVTAVAVLQLEEQGKLHLDDQVSDYLPLLNIEYPNETSNTITIRNLLNHSSGIPDAGYKILIWTHQEGEPHLNQTEMLRDVFSDFAEIEFEPGAQSKYTNIGYMVLGAIIEKVSNKNYEDYIRQHILEPLEMTKTDFIYKEEMRLFEASGTHPIFDPFTPIVPFVAGSFVRETTGNQIWFDHIYTDQTPPSGLIGSAADAANLVKAFLNNGILENNRILSEESIRQMTSDSYVKLSDDPTDYFVRQGIGWRIFKDENTGLILEHTGGGIGFSTIMQIQPERDLGFILFANNTNCEGWRIIQKASSLEW